jgi:hypothetical protein
MRAGANLSQPNGMAVLRHTVVNRSATLLHLSSLPNGQTPESGSFALPLLASHCKGYFALCLTQCVTMVPSNEPEVTPVTVLSKRSTVKLPVAPANRPVPPVMVYVSTIKKTSGSSVR